MGSYCSSPGESFHAKYRIGELLGKGSQGRVHTCVNRETNVKCAVKLIDRNVRNSWTTFRREVDLCRTAIECPNVVTILDEFVDLSFCYVVMEKYASHLRKALRIGSKQPGVGVGLENPVLRRVVKHAMCALVHLHTLEIVHRDVKAQNFLVDRTNLRDPKCLVVLSDFGLARKLPIGHKLNAQVGTRKYWAPDLYNKKYWHNVDVFAIGVLIFLAGSGTYPYADETQVLERDIFAEDAVPPILSSDATDFMKLCLKKDPYARPGSDELMSHVWLRTAPTVDCTQEESVTANQESDTVSTAAPSGPLGASVSSPATQTSTSLGCKLGRTLAIPLPVPQGDAADHLDAENLEVSDMEEVAIDKRDSNEDPASPGETTVSGAECGSSPRTDYMQSAPVEDEFTGGDRLGKSRDNFFMTPQHVYVQAVSRGGKIVEDMTPMMPPVSCQSHPANDTDGNDSLATQSTVVDFDEQGLWHYAS